MLAAEEEEDLVGVKAEVREEEGVEEGGGERLGGMVVKVGEGGGWGLGIEG